MNLTTKNRRNHFNIQKGDFAYLCLLKYSRQHFPLTSTDQDGFLDSRNVCHTSSYSQYGLSRAHLQFGWKAKA